MDFSKLTALISAFVLIVCLVLAMTTLVVLRNAVAENEQVQNEAKTLIDDLGASVDKLESTSRESFKDETGKDIPTNVNTERFTLREYEGSIAIYDETGTMLHWLSVNLSLLPQSERNALAEGIEIEGRSSLISCLQDYMS